MKLHDPLGIFFGFPEDGFDLSERDSFQSVHVDISGANSVTLGKYAV